jgi:hypothetical protein
MRARAVKQLIQLDYSSKAAPPVGVTKPAKKLEFEDTSTRNRITADSEIQSFRPSRQVAVPV